MADTGFRVTAVEDNVVLQVEDEEEIVTYTLSPEEGEALAMAIYVAVRSIE